MASSKHWRTPSTGTRRLYFRRLDLGDVDFVFKLYSNWEVSRHLSKVTFPFKHQHAEEFVSRVMSGNEVGEALSMIIERKDNHVDVGFVSLSKFRDLAILGFSIIPEEWNKGYATEAANRVVEFAFNDLEIETIQASPIEDNVASIKVLEKLDFQVHERGILENSVHSGERLVTRYRLTHPEL